MTQTESSTENRKRILSTMLTMLAILSFYFIAGASVVMNGLKGAAAKYMQGLFIWLSVIAVIVFALIRQKSLKPFGFRKMAAGSSKRLFFFAPVLIVAMLGIIGGINFGEDGNYILGSLFLTVGVGLSEEIYFRGIICNQWMKTNRTAAVFLSAILFGICHLLNLLGGAGFVETILQIFFAFFYGIVFALMFIGTKSIWPCIVLHFLHDFCSFIGNDVPNNVENMLAAIQTILLVVYAFMIWKRVCGERKGEL